MTDAGDDKLISLLLETAQHCQPAVLTRRKSENRRQDRRRSGHRIAENPAAG